MDKYELCKGCLSYNNSAQKPGCILIGDGEGYKVCPCSICLIKGICVKPCKAYTIALARKHRGISNVL